MTEVWAPRLAHMQHSTVSGGHFFVDQNPKGTLAHLQHFLLQNAPPQQRLQY
jgi:surfactin synthase thioesterase subunit